MVSARQVYAHLANLMPPQPYSPWEHDSSGMSAWQGGNRAASDAPTKNFRACVLQRIRQQNAEAETGFVIVVVDQRIAITAEYLYQSLETLA